METYPPTGLFIEAANGSRPSSPALKPSTKKRRAAGRRRDPVWDWTTVLPDKRVVCNRCEAVIHRYGVAKVERVRAHFERKCPVVASSLATSKRSNSVDETPPIIQPEIPRLGVTMAQRASSSSNYGNKNGAFKRKFAYWVYATGQSFDIARNELILNALRVVRQDVALPSKHELENELLDLEFTASKNKVTKALGNQRCCLTVEICADVGGYTITTFGARKEGLSFFLESKTVPTPENSGILMANEVEAVLAKEKKMELCGIVTPTTSVLSHYTRERIQKKHPRCIFFYGCVSCALTLLLQDVCTILPWLDTVQKTIADFVAVFHGKYTLQTEIKTNQNLQTAAEFPEISSICASLEDVLKCEKVLYTIVARRDFVEASTPVEHEKRKRVQDFVLNENFVRDLVNSLDILRPLQQQLQHFQENQPPLSEVVSNLVKLLTLFSSLEWMSKKEKALITSCVSERFNAIYGDSHGVASTLDPRYLGKALDDKKMQEVENFLVRFCEHEDHNVDILSQLQRYKAMVLELKETNQAYWQQLQSGAIKPTEFWEEHRNHFPHLHELAVAVFSLPSSSVSRSPSFGAQMQVILSRFGNKLPPSQLIKLTHVFCNSQGDIKELVELKKEKDGESALN
ncbi:uncharacterized protein CCR75_000631 [Bremia lactucae]|uniref:BED-type domain-containing protein n=1 Tax=Bremia lactucae TaxID=4779 RepID=A0A976FDL5_BRELC|nr:hypothetical protein CCR75_000631 [Bremia lactucae]